MDLETRYPVRVSIPVAWGEMDSLGHVNNIMYFRYFETARIEYFRALGMKLPPDDGVGPILASTRCDFRLPVSYPDRLEVRAGISRIGRSSYTMLYEIHSEALGAVAATGEGVVVNYDYKAARSAPLSEDMLARIRQLESFSQDDVQK